MQTATLTIPAMHKEAVAIEVAKALETVAGVDTVHITLSHNRARVGYNENVTTALDLRAAVESAGYIVADAPAGHSCCGGCGG